MKVRIDYRDGAYTLHEPRDGWPDGPGFIDIHDPVWEAYRAFRVQVALWDAFINLLANQEEQ